MLTSCYRTTAVTLSIFLLWLANSVNVIADPPSPGRYEGRDGATQALSDLKAGKRTKLYSHAVNSAQPTVQTPGLSGCIAGHPRYLIDPRARDLFAPLPEADWAEAVPYSPEQLARAASAIRFARSYNRAMFRARKADILRVCPNAKVSD